jgi:hypothetical protein
LSKPGLLVGWACRCDDGNGFLGPEGKACRTNGLAAPKFGPGEPVGEKACFRLAEFPGLLMKSRDSMASCSLTF